MKKTFTFWKSLFLLCALIVGSSSAWAEDVEKTDTYSFTTSGCTGWTTDNAGSYCGGYGKNKDASFYVMNKSISNFSSVDFSSVSNPSVTIYVKALTNGGTNSYTVSLVNSSGTVVGTPVTKNGGMGNGSNSSSASESYVTLTPVTGATGYRIDFNPRAAITQTRYTLTYKTSSDPSSEASFTNTTPSINFPSQTTYSQTATTASGYTGTIEYEITQNTAGATIDGSTVTVTKGGSVTVKATAPAIDGSWAKSEATYTLTVNDTRSANGLAYSETEQEVVVGEVLNAPTLTNPHNLNVTYSSEDETIATVDASGNVTGVKVGTTTIYANFDGNNEYKDGSVSYELTVKKAPYAIIDGVFDFAEAGSSSPRVDYGSGVTPTSNGQVYIEEEKTWTAGNVTMVTDGKYRWWSGSNGYDLRFYGTSSAAFSVPDGYVITKIVSTGGNFSSSNNVGTLSGSTWTGCYQSVTLSTSSNTTFTKFTVSYTTANQTFTPAKTYTTLTSAYALNFTDVSGLKAYIATEVSEGNVQMTQVNKVPANTGLVLKATTPGSAVDVPVFDGTGADDVSGNKMAGSATSTTAIAANGGYILKNGIFQPANEGTLAAGKAYLAITVTSARALEMSFEDTTTGIIGVEEVAPVTKTRKVVKNGRLVIETANGEFTVSGARVK